MVVGGGGAVGLCPSKVSEVFYLRSSLREGVGGGMKHTERMYVRKTQRECDTLCVCVCERQKVCQCVRATEATGILSRTPYNFMKLTQLC